MSANPLCLWFTRAALVLLLVAWGAWAPYAIRERRMPQGLKWMAFAAVGAGITLTALVMPLACQCGGKL